jgi:ribosomal protein S18 acetylase RimI-like enzyme
MELTAMAGHLARLAVHSGAVALDEPELGVLMLTTEDRDPARNYAALPRWTPATWKRGLTGVVARMREAGAWPSLLVTESASARWPRTSTADAAAWLPGTLASAGWTPGSRETVLWVGSASVVPHLDTSLRIEAVQPGAVNEHQALEAAIFGLSPRDHEERKRGFAQALAGGRLRAYLVRVGGVPVGVARLSLADQDAGVYGIGVAREWRRQGIGTLISIVATRAGLAMGRRLVWVSVDDAQPGARHMYERLGFREAFAWTRWMAPHG